MKKLMICLFASALLSQFAPAQPPNDPPRDGPPRSDWQNKNRAMRPDSRFHDAMNELRKQDPEKFEQLQELRMTDPGAFREEIHSLIRTAVINKLKVERPNVYEAVTTLNPEDRAWVIDVLAKSKFDDGSRMPMGKPPKDGPRDERKDIRKLINQYNNIESEEERAVIRTELKDHISKQYDQRIEMGKADLSEMEEKLNQAREALRKGQQKKEQFIDEMLSHMLD